MIQNQDPSKQQVHIEEGDTKCNVAEEENNGSTNKDKDTLYQTDAAKGEVSTSRGNWRDSSN